MKKIIITDKLNDQVIEIFQSNNVEVNYCPGITNEELLKVISDYNGLIVRSQTQVTKEIIQKGKKLKVIGRAGTGTDNIDIDAATRSGILVMNTPGGNTYSAAEHTIAILLSLCRKIPQANKSMREGLWERKNFYGTELFNKTIGIIGLGKIGREVAIRLKAFDTNILGYDPFLSESVADEYGIKLTTISEIIEKSDIISVHVPLNEKTRDLISFNEIDKLKKGVILVNCARGGIINEDAVLLGIEKEIISGAAFDVFENEPPVNKKFIENPFVLTTPHLGASTNEAQEKVSLQICEQIIDLFKNENMAGVVNASALKYLSDKSAKPFLIISQKLGELIPQVFESSIKKISISFNGPEVNKYYTLLTSSILKGIFSKMMDNINLINATVIAEENGINIDVKKSNEKIKFNNLITIDVENDKNKFSLQGTIGLNNEPRIVSINNYNLDIIPEGKFLLYFNVDIPGVLAKVSDFLAKKNINIAGLTLGRKDKGLEAITLIKIDEELSRENLDVFNSIVEINNVYRVFF